MTSPRGPIFDAHCHAGTWAAPDFLGQASDPGEVAGTLLRAGVSRALVMPTDQRDNAGLLEWARVYEGPLSLRIAMWVAPADNGLVEDVRSHRDQISALKIHPSFSRRRVTDPGFAPLLELAGELALPVIVHCGRWQEMASFRFAIEAARCHADTTFVLAHMGGDQPALVVGAAEAIAREGLRNAYLGTECVREYWAIQRALAIVGPERIVFGSDHNLHHPAVGLAIIDALGLAPQVERRILWDNAVALFG